jgi:hypothetical protein
MKLEAGVEMFVLADLMHQSSGYDRYERCGRSFSADTRKHFEGLNT